MDANNYTKTAKGLLKPLQYKKSTHASGITSQPPTRLYFLKIAFSGGVDALQSGVKTAFYAKSLHTSSTTHLDHSTKFWQNA